MAVKLRLTRIGTTKRPYYRLMAMDSRSPQQGGKHLEILGTYDPMNLALPKTSTQKEAKGIVNIKTDRVKYWLSVGAQTSPTVKTLLKRLSITTEAA